MKTDRVAYARSLGVHVGEHCRFPPSAGTFGTEPYLIKIGNHVEVTYGARFITHDGGVWVFRENDPEIEVFGPIVVEDNVFIGNYAIILPGVTIGRDSVIGAGAVVTRDVPSGSVVAGVPARVIENTEEYAQKVKGKATHVRSFPPEKKRRFLQEHFWQILDPDRSNR
jgi:acetyltransferase-like isoleucine patch superfamily enzyme